MASVQPGSGGHREPERIENLLSVTRCLQYDGNHAGALHVEASGGTLGHIDHPAGPQCWTSVGDFDVAGHAVGEIGDENLCSERQSTVRGGQLRGIECRSAAGGSAVESAAIIGGTSFTRMCRNDFRRLGCNGLGRDIRTGSQAEHAW